MDSVPFGIKDSVFVVNGGTCEKTKILVNNKYPGLTEKDRGISDAFSKGVRRSSAKYIHFLNSGDKIYDQSFYEQALEVFELDQGVDYVFSNIIYKHRTLGDLIVTPNQKALKNIAFGMPFPHPGLIVKREIFEKIGYFDEQFKIGMDYDFIVRMLKGNFKGMYLNIVSVEMDGRGISSSKPIKSIFENMKSLKINNKLGFKEITIISYRITRTITGIIFKKIGLNGLIKKVHARNFK